MLKTVHSKIKQHSMASDFCRQIIVLGKTGSGKSSLGNSLLGTSAFEVQQSLNAVTEKCKKRSENNICVIDTPGLLDLNNHVADTALEILLSLNKCPRPHAFLIVFSALTRTGHDELRTISLLRLIFNESILNHAIVVFTGYDDKATESDFDNFWKSNAMMKEFVEACGGRVARIDNKGSEISQRVKEILHCVDIVCEDGQKRFDSNFKSVNENVLRRIQRENAELAMKNPNLQKKALAIETFDEEVQQIRKCLSTEYHSLLSSASWQEKIRIANALLGLGCVAAGAILIAKGKVKPGLAAVTGAVSSAGIAAFINRTLEATQAFLITASQAAPSALVEESFMGHMDNLMRL